MHMPVTDFRNDSLQGFYYLQLPLQNSMAITNLSIKFGNPTPDNAPSPFSINAEINQQKIKSHYKKHSTLLSKYRLPLVVVEMPAWLQALEFPPIENILEGKTAKEKLIKGQRCYLMYEHRDSQQIVVLKKLERILEKLTNLKNSAYVHFVFFDLAQKRQIIKEDNSKFLELVLENLLVEAKIDLDGDFVKTFGELVGKISPGFEMSPVVGFLELFQEASLQLEFENPSILKGETREQAFPEVLGFQEPGEEDEQSRLVTKMLESEEKINLYINFGKLGYVKFSGQARIWAFILCLGANI